jgi:hypothetical protein
VGLGDVLGDVFGVDVDIDLGDEEVVGLGDVLGDVAADLGDEFTTALGDDVALFVPFSVVDSAGRVTVADDNCKIGTDRAGAGDKGITGDGDEGAPFGDKAARVFSETDDDFGDVEDDGDTDWVEFDADKEVGVALVVFIEVGVLEEAPEEELGLDDVAGDAAFFRDNENGELIIFLRFLGVSVPSARGEEIT